MMNFPCKCGHSHLEGSFGRFYDLTVQCYQTDGVGNYICKCYRYKPDNLGYLEQRYGEITK